MKFLITYTCYRHSGQFVANCSVQLDVDLIDWAEIVKASKEKLEENGIDTCDLIIIPTAIIPKPDIKENDGLGAKFYFAVITALATFKIVEWLFSKLF